MANNCSICGVNMDMVGRSHRCVPRKEIVKIVNTVYGTNYRAADGTVPKTYLHRDPDKRRAYMRDYMKRKRNAGNEKDDAGIQAGQASQRQQEGSAG